MSSRREIAQVDLTLIIGNGFGEYEKARRRLDRLGRFVFRGLCVWFLRRRASSGDHRFTQSGFAAPAAVEFRISLNANASADRTKWREHEFNASYVRAFD